MEEGERRESRDKQNPKLVHWKNNHMKILWQERRGEHNTGNKPYKEEINADTTQILK